jgi:GT2 family glycosyltransferase
MKTLIGIATFGNLPFTQLTINSIRATTQSPVDFFVVVGQPNDLQTSAWLAQQGIPHHCHEANYGFPVALNDIMDYAFRVAEKNPRDAGAPRSGSYDNLILVGNDVVPYPNAVDALIEEARREDWEWICSSQFDVKSLVARYPELAGSFTGPNLNFEQWTTSRSDVVEGRESRVEVIEYTPLVRPWERHRDFHAPAVQPDCIKDVRNLCLFKRSVFEKIGYADVNFWPGGYFEDNDYCTRARKAGVKACGLAHSAYFHFWSRTIHQGDGTKPRQFQNNAAFYETKWGGGFDHERYELPFNGVDQVLGPGALKVVSRDQEGALVEYWRQKTQ